MMVQTAVSTALKANYFFDKYLTKPIEERSVSKVLYRLADALLPF